MIELPECNSVLHCPKCRALASEFVATAYHPEIQALMIEGHAIGGYPCTQTLYSCPSEETEELTEHLCKRCRRCGFGWMEQVAEETQNQAQDQTQEE